MTDSKWQALLESLEIVGGADALRPIDSDSLDAVENTLGIKLPASYRSFCRVFGAGSFGSGDLNIAVPGSAGNAKTYSLEYLTNSQRELAGQFGNLGLDSIFWSRESQVWGPGNGMKSDDAGGQCFGKMMKKTFAMT